jgi:hypothetical protein
MGLGISALHLLFFSSNFYQHCSVAAAVDWFKSGRHMSFNSRRFQIIST